MSPGETMSTRDVERVLREEVRQSTPDLLDGLLEELGLDGQEPTARSGLDATVVGAPVDDDATSAVNLSLLREAAPARTCPRRSARTARRRVGLPVLALLALAVGLFALMRPQREPFAVVGLDVNPSIEISVDSRERVLGATALNDEAAIVLQDLELEGTELGTACHAVVGSMLVKGYLRSDANSLLVSVRSADAEAGKVLEHRLSQELNDYLENSEVAVAILGQYVEDSDELEHFAEQRGISQGKAWLIQKLLASEGTRMDEAALLKLGTQELILLAQERHVESQTSIGTSDTSRFIARDEALSIALADAGAERREVRESSVEFDCEDGVIVYEVEFRTDSGDHEYLIDAASGAIVEHEVEAAGEIASPLPQEQETDDNPAEAGVWAGDDEPDDADDEEDDDADDDAGWSDWDDDADDDMDDDEGDDADDDMDDDADGD